MSRSDVFPWTFVLTFLITFGCATTTAPDRYQQDPDVLPQDPYGAWIRLVGQDGITEGELLAVHEDSIFVATPECTAVARSRIRSARVTLFDSQAGQYMGLTALGMLSTFSHGIILVASAPIWLLGGSLMASARSREALLDYPSHPWSRLRAHARFPQGLPDTVDRSSLAPKW